MVIAALRDTCITPVIISDVLISETVAGNSGATSCFSRVKKGKGCGPAALLFMMRVAVLFCSTGSPKYCQSTLTFVSLRVVVLLDRFGSVRSPPNLLPVSVKPSTGDVVGRAQGGAHHRNGRLLGGNRVTPSQLLLFEANSRNTENMQQCVSV